MPSSGRQNKINSIFLEMFCFILICLRGFRLFVCLFVFPILIFCLCIMVLNFVFLLSCVWCMCVCDCVNFLGFCCILFYSGFLIYLPSEKKKHEVGRIERRRVSEKKNHDQNAMYEKLFLTEILALVYMYKISRVQPLLSWGQSVSGHHLLSPGY